MKKADASGAPVAVIRRDEEEQAGEASVKLWREERAQFRVPRNALRMRYRICFLNGEKE